MYGWFLHPDIYDLCLYVKYRTLMNERSFLCENCETYEFYDFHPCRVVCLQFSYWFANINLHNFNFCVAGYTDPAKPNLSRMHEWHFRFGFDLCIISPNVILNYCLVRWPSFFLLFIIFGPTILNIKDFTISGWEMDTKIRREWNQQRVMIKTGIVSTTLFLSYMYWNKLIRFLMVFYSSILLL